MKMYLPLMENNIDRNDINELVGFLQQDPIPQLTNGAKVREFEKAWSEWLGVEHSLFVNSGSSANILTMLALREFIGLNKEDEVICPPLGWVSDPVSILHAGLRPVFCDINLQNLSYDIEKLKKVITPKTRAILAVSVLGLNCYTPELLDFCKKNYLLLIGDHCESHGATYQGKKLGSFEDISNFSFFFAHHMSTIEGGMICTNNELVYQFLRACRSHGMAREMIDEKWKQGIVESFPTLNPDFIFVAPAYNMRSTEINAVLGLSQLKKLDANNVNRQQNFNYFLQNLDSNKYLTDFAIEGQCNYAFIVILKNPSFEARNLVEKTLREYLIEFRRGLSGGGNQLLQPYLKNKIKYDLVDFPNVQHVHNFSWYIGNYPTLEKNKIDNLLRILNSINV